MGRAPKGAVKHGRFLIGGHVFVAMDAPGEHGFSFNEGISLQVMCTDLAEVDHYSGALTRGGSQEPCGWLKDRFGLCWQVVPEAIVEWMTSSDAVTRDRAFQTLLEMTKLDVAALERAFAGR